MRFKTTLLVMSMLGVGTVLGWQMRGESTAEYSNGTAEPRLIETTVRASAREPSAIDIDRLRQVVREELLAARAIGDGRAAPAIVQAPVTPELTAQRRAAVDEIETMIRGGEWGNAQRATFHQQMTLLDPEQGARLLREVTIAFNQGTMKVTTDGPPL